MKSLFVFIIVLCFGIMAYSQIPEYVKDSTICKLYNSNTSSFEPYKRDYYTYNEEGLLIEELQFLYSSFFDEWYHGSLIYSYDEYYNLIEKLARSFNSETQQWNDSGKETFKYENGNMVERIVFSIPAPGEPLQGYLKEIFIFDSKGNLEVHQTWGSISADHWSLNSEDRYLYDENGFIQEVLFYVYDANTQTLIERLLEEFSTDQNGNVIEIIENYNHPTEAWIPGTVDSFYYDQQNNLTREVAIDVEYPDNWIYDWRRTYTYSNNLLIEERHDSWEDTYWEVTSRINYSYDQNDNEIELLIEVWKQESSQWEPGLKCESFWRTFTVAVQEYPYEYLDCWVQNPSNNRMIINCNTQLSQNSKIYLFDVLGNLVHIDYLSGQGEIELNLEYVTGIYFIIIREGNDVVFREKIVLSYEY